MMQMHYFYEISRRVASIHRTAGTGKICECRQANFVQRASGKSSSRKLSCRGFVYSDSRGGLELQGPAPYTQGDGRGGEVRPGWTCKAWRARKGGGQCPVSDACVTDRAAVGVVRVSRGRWR